MLILDGLKVATTKTQELKQRVQALPRPPRLIIFRVGDNAASDRYILAKQKQANKIGIKVRVVHLHADIDQKRFQAKMIRRIRRYDGAIVQLPLPSHMNKQEVLDTIPYEKDVDGLAFGNNIVTPATPKGIMSLLTAYDFSVTGCSVAVVGQSRLVGQPVAHLCERAGASSVARYNRKSGIQGTEKADILIVAAGHAGLIKAANVKRGSVVIDVGINEIADENAMRRIVGDVDRHSVNGLLAAISPVPGGVGPMTVISLMENTVEACERKFSVFKKST